MSQFEMSVKCKPCKLAQNYLHVKTDCHWWCDCTSWYQCLSDTQL